MRSGAVITAGALATLGAGLALNRHLGRRWGATDAEVNATLPGDDVISDPVWQTTHGITIPAPAADIWPWLVQMGITLGGWYLSERLDRVVWRIENPSVDRIVPELQHLAVGDVVPDSVDGTAHFRVVSIEPERALVLHSRRHPKTGIWPDPSSADPGLYLDFSWAFVLREIAPGTTRLLLRTRAIIMDGRRPAPAWMRLGLPVVDLADFIYTRQMLRGIRRRVLAAPDNSPQQPEPSDDRIHRVDGASGRPVVTLRGNHRSRCPDSCSINSADPRTTTTNRDRDQRLRWQRDTSQTQGQRT